MFTYGMKILVPLLLIAVFIAGCDQDAISEDRAVFLATLTPLNSSGVTGLATFRVREDETFVAELFAENVVANKTHPQHIHGFADQGDAFCPSNAAADDIDGLPEEAGENADAIIALEEAADEYGPIQLPLDSQLDEAQPGDFPTPKLTTINYSEVVPLEELGAALLGDDPAQIQLEDNHVVVHGGFVNGTYVPTLPVACGPIVRVESLPETDD